MCLQHVLRKYKMLYLNFALVSASGSETSVSSSTPTSAINYDAYTSIKKNHRCLVVSNIVSDMRGQKFKTQTLRSKGKLVN